MAEKQQQQPATQSQDRARGGLPMIVLAICTIAIGLMVFSPPALIVFLVGMVPTAVAIYIDSDPRKDASLCVAAMNFAGVSFYLVGFLAGSASFSRAIELVSNVFVIAVIYGAAAGGWLLVLAMPPLTAVFLKVLAENRIHKLRKEQNELVKNWGDDVVNG